MGIGKKESAAQSRREERQNLARKTVSDLPSLPDMSTVVSDDESEIGTQGQPQQTVNGRDRPDLPEIEAVRLPDSLSKLIAHQ